MHANIPTEYRGVKFRSRLEARWAVMFDLLEWQWEYEPIDLNGWIPDFIVQTSNLAKYDDSEMKPALVEVKPVYGVGVMHHMPLEVREKIERALGAPNKFSGAFGSNKWTEFFEQLPYEPMFLGATLCSWPWEPAPIFNPFLGLHFQNNVAWWPIRFHHFLNNLNNLWIEAGNYVQWKAPR